MGSRYRVALLLAPLVLVVGGCHKPKTAATHPVAPTRTPPKVAKRPPDLSKPSSWASVDLPAARLSHKMVQTPPTARQNGVYGKDTFPFTIASRQTSAGFELKLSAFDTLFETETYKVDDNGLALKAIDGEAFIPPISLCRFATTNAPLSWEGTISIAGRNHRASAVSSVRGVRVSHDGRDADYTLIKSDIEILDEGPTAPRRTHWFWIGEKGGIEMRESSFGVARYPQ